MRYYAEHRRCLGNARECIAKARDRNDHFWLGCARSWLLCARNWRDMGGVVVSLSIQSQSAYVTQPENTIAGLELAMLRAINAKQTAQEAATAAAGVLKEYCRIEGMNPEIEVVLRGPGHVGPGWFVCLEAGPSMWGVEVSMLLTVSVGRLVETHYGCDLCFYEEE